MNLKENRKIGLIYLVFFATMSLFIGCQGNAISDNDFGGDEAPFDTSYTDYTEDPTIGGDSLTEDERAFKQFAAYLWGKMEEVSSAEGRQETGCYIYRNNITHRLEMGSLKYGPIVTGNEGTHGSIKPGSPMPSLNGFDKSPRGTFTPVGFMHSHTTMEYMGEDCERQVGPSQEDEDWADEYNCPVYTVDYVGKYRDGTYKIYGGEESDYKIYTTY